MAFAQGTNESIILGPEASFKTLPGTVVGDKLPVINPGGRPSRNKFKSQSLTGSPEPRSIVLGKLGFDYEFGLECNPASIQSGLFALLGTRRQYGLGSVFASDYCLGALVSQFIEQRHTDINKFLLYNGVYVGSMGLSIAAEGIMEARIGCKAARQTNSGATVVNSTITDRTGYEPFSYALVRVKQGGSVIAFSQQVDLNIDRKLGMAVAQDQTNEQAVIFSEIAEITGSMTALFTDTSLLDVGLLGTDTSIEIWLPGINGWGLLLEAATLKFQPGQVQTNGTGLDTQRLDFELEGKAGFSKYPGRNWSSYWTTATLPALNGLTLIIAPDGGGNQTFTFTAGDLTMDLVAARINATATGMTASIDRAAGDTGGVLRIESNTKGTNSSILVQVASTADTVLGIDNATHSGKDGISLLTTVLSPLAA